MARETDSPAAAPQGVVTRGAGLILAVGSILALALMAHHPTTGAETLEGAVAEMQREAVLSGLVHGGLVVMFAVIFWGFLGLADQLGWRLPSVRLGVLAYGLGVVALGGAALINGFVVPGLAARYAGQADAELESLRALWTLCAALNLTLTRAGVVALSLAILAWSVALARRPGAARICGGLGLGVGLVSLAALVGGRLQMTVHGLGALMLLQAVWNLSIAAWLVRSPAGEPTPR